MYAIRSYYEFGINSVNISLKNSNLEVLNDELILFKDSKLLQFLNIKTDESSTFFYSDILTHRITSYNVCYTKLLRLL